MKEKIIYMPWLAAELRRLGFRIIRTEVNPHRPQFDIYIFEETPELLEALTKLTNKQ